MKRKIKYLCLCAFIWISGSLYLLHSNRDNQVKLNTVQQLCMYVGWEEKEGVKMVLVIAGAEPDNQCKPPSRHLG